MKPTTEQDAILEAVTSTNSNLMLSAYAGCGKTATLELIDAAVKVQPHLLVCFNKAIANEAERRMRSTTTVRTFNSLGHRIWAAYLGKNLTLNTKKVYELFRGVLDESPKSTHNAIWGCYDAVSAGVNLARALGYVPSSHAYASKALIKQTQFHGFLDETPDDLTSDLIDAILTRSISRATAGEIDFNDQVYMPALFGGTYPKFPLVLIDEYQDLSPINHAMVAKLCKSSRQIGVGDDAQSIYAFRGAKAGSMSSAVVEYSMTQLGLSVSFRCPSEIVRNVHWRVPNFKSFRDGGTVDSPTVFDANTFSDSATIICRNNAPLIRMAFQLLAAGHSVSVAGTDIGPRLVKTMTKLGSTDMSQAQTLSAIEDWLEAKLTKESKTAEDYAECMRVFARHGSTLGTAIAYAEHLFKQEGTIRLLTGHKSKGLEFDHVYHLDKHILRDKGQDRNIHYVIDTRSKDRLTYINTDSIQWQ